MTPGDEKTGCHHCCIRGDTRVSHQTEEPTNTHQHLKMGSVTTLIGGALVYAPAFTCSSYLFSRLSKDDIDKERKRHELVIEQLQKVQVEWAQK